MQLHTTAITLLLAPLFAACASQPPPPAESATTSTTSAAAAPAAETSASPADVKTFLDALKSQMRPALCGAKAPLRACFAIPGEAACARTVDAAWPGCTQGITMKAVNESEGERVGQQVGACVALETSKKFKATDTPACRKSGETHAP